MPIAERSAPWSSTTGTTTGTGSLISSVGRVALGLGLGRRIDGLLGRGLLGPGFLGPGLLGAGLLFARLLFARLLLAGLLGLGLVLGPGGPRPAGPLTQARVLLDLLEP